MFELIGLSFVGEVTLFKVEIEGRGGDSVHDEYFETEQGAIIASAVDGQNLTPKPVRVFKLSDGTYVDRPRVICVSTPPDKKQLDKLLEGMTPAQKLLLRRKKFLGQA